MLFEFQNVINIEIIGFVLMQLGFVLDSPWEMSRRLEDVLEVFKTSWRSKNVCKGGIKLFLINKQFGLKQLTIQIKNNEMGMRFPME